MEIGGKEGVSFRARQAELEINAEKADQAAQRARKNRDFAQVYPRGWQRIRELADVSPQCVKLYALLAEHSGNNGAVVVSQTQLAAMLGVTDRTVRTLSKQLEDSGAVARIKVGTGTYAYALDPREVWRSWETTKAGAAFNTRTLVDRNAAREGHARLHTMLEKDAAEGSEVDD